MDPMGDAFPFETLGLINILPFESTGVQMSIFCGGSHNWRKLQTYSLEDGETTHGKKVNSNIIGGNGINTIVCHLPIVLTKLPGKLILH